MSGRRIERVFLEDPGKMKRIFKVEIVADLLDLHFGMDAHDLPCPVDFEFHKSLERRQSEQSVADAVQGTAAHAGFEAEGLQRRHFCQILFENPEKLGDNIPVHGVTDEIRIQILLRKHRNAFPEQGLKERILDMAVFRSGMPVRFLPDELDDRFHKRTLRQFRNLLPTWQVRSKQSCQLLVGTLFPDETNSPGCTAIASSLIRHLYSFRTGRIIS